MRIAESGFHAFFHKDQRFVDLLFQTGRVLFVVGVIIGTDLGGNGETRGNRDAYPGHFRQVGPFAAQKLLHPGMAFGLAIAKRINILLAHDYPPFTVRVLVIRLSEYGPEHDATATSGSRNDYRSES